MATDERKLTPSNSTAGSPRADRVPARREEWPGFWSDPFAIWSGRGENPMRRLAREMDRWFNDITESRWPRGHGERGTRQLSWNPDIETFQRGDQFVIRADLPGMRKDDVTVHLTDDGLTIEGERRYEHEEQQDRYYRSERSYGRFCRVVPLRDGAIPETAHASFENGVLEVVVQAAPHEVSRGRRLEINERRGEPSRPASTDPGREPSKFPE